MMWQLIAMEDCTDFDALSRVCDETYPRISAFVCKYRDIRQTMIDEFCKDPIPLIVCANDRGKSPVEREKLMNSYLHHTVGLSTLDLLKLGHLTIIKDAFGNDSVVPCVYGHSGMCYEKCLLKDFESDLSTQMRIIRQGCCYITSV